MTHEMSDDPSPFRIGSWSVDPRSRTVTNGADVKRLSPRALGVLRELFRAEGAPVSRQGLLDRVWPNVLVGDESLTQAVAELRRVFKDRDGSTPIETIAKTGYRLRESALPSAAEHRNPVAERTDRFDLNAYKLCLDARSIMNRGHGNVVRTAEALTKEAVQAANDFGFAHAEYAIALCYRWLYQRDDERGAEKALSHADAAVQLRPDLGRSYAARAMALGALGQTAPMIKSLEQGLAVDHDDPDLHFLGARVMFAARDYTAAAALAERAATLSTDDYWSLYFAVRATAAFDPPRSRRLAVECLARVRARLMVDPDEPRALNLMGPLLASLGRHEDAVASVTAQSGEWSTLRFYDAVAMATAGQNHLALETLSELIDRGWRHGDWLMAEPAFDDMRRDPGFAKTVAQLRAA